MRLKAEGGNSSKKEKRERIGVKPASPRQSPTQKKTHEVLGEKRKATPVSFCKSGIRGLLKRPKAVLG